MYDRPSAGPRPGTQWRHRPECVAASACRLASCDHPVEASCVGLRFDPELRSLVAIPSRDPFVRSHRQIQCLDSVYPGIVGNSLCQPADSPHCDRLFKTSCRSLWFDPELQSPVTIPGCDPVVHPSPSPSCPQPPSPQYPSPYTLRGQEPAAWDWDVMLIFRSRFCSGEQKEEDYQLVKDAMESMPASFMVPLKVEVKTGRTWAECK